MSKDPDLLHGRNGKPKLETYDQRHPKPNTRTAVGEVLQEVATRTERAGTLALSTSALYAPWMVHDAVGAGLLVGVQPEQWTIAGVPAPESALAARAKAPLAIYGAEIIKAAEAAAYHQQSLIVLGKT
jgi:hypothetical protein